MLRHGQITDSEIYLEDNTLFGIAEEIDIPEIELTEIEHQSLGSVAVFAVPGRAVKSLKVKMKLRFVEPTLQPIIFNPTVSKLLQVHSKVDINGDDGLDVDNSFTLITAMRTRFGKVSHDTAKNSDQMMVTAEGFVTYLMQRAYTSETPFVEIDALNNVYKVNGDNVWPT